MLMPGKTRTVFILCVGLICLAIAIRSVRAEGVLYLSSSSQIAEAFGKDVITRYEDRHETKVSLHIGCSRTALVRLENGFSDLACIASRLPREYRKKGYVDIPFARDPLVVVIHGDNPVRDLSRRELRNIFMHNVSNWKELGGVDAEIITFVPREATALFRNFERQVMEGYDVAYDFKSYISTRSIFGVKHILGAVAIASQGAVEKREGIKTVGIEGHDPGDDDYPFFQTFSFVSKGEPDQNAKEFINAALSQRGREIIREKGMQPILDEEKLREAQ
jgi:phosphate transport system substrate-binding protein